MRAALPSLENKVDGHVLDSSILPPRTVLYLASGLEPKLSRLVTAGRRASSNRSWQPSSLFRETDSACETNATGYAPHLQLASDRRWLEQRVVVQRRHGSIGVVLISFLVPSPESFFEQGDALFRFEETLMRLGENFLLRAGLLEHLHGVLAALLHRRFDGQVMLQLLNGLLRRPHGLFVRVGVVLLGAHRAARREQFALQPLDLQANVLDFGFGVFEQDLRLVAHLSRRFLALTAVRRQQRFRAGFHFQLDLELFLERVDALLNGVLFVAGGGLNAVRR